MNTESQNVEINILSNNQELEVEELSLNVEIENMSLEVEMQNSDVEIETQSNDIEIEDEVLRVFEKDHSQLKNLDFESSGHTGFQKAGDYALKEDIPDTSNFVEDSNYIHTDNNFTDEDKEKLDSLENISVDAKNIPFEDNYGYGTPDNMQDALDYAFEELDNRMTYDVGNYHYVSYNTTQNKNATQQAKARANIGALGITDLGEVDLYDEYQGDIDRFLDTLITTGFYTFYDAGDDFYWFVEVYRLENGSIGQAYWGSEEGYLSKTYRTGYYDEDDDIFYFEDDARYLTSSQASAMFASKSHSHFSTISTANDIRTYLNNYTSYTISTDLRVISNTNKHVYMVKIDYTNYVSNGINVMVRYQEYYDIEEPNRIYKRTGYYNASTRVITWGDWYVFEGVSE